MISAYNIPEMVFNEIETKKGFWYIPENRNGEHLYFKYKDESKNDTCFTPELNIIKKGERKPEKQIIRLWHSNRDDCYKDTGIYCKHKITIEIQNKTGFFDPKPETLFKMDLDDWYNDKEIINIIKTTSFDLKTGQYLKIISRGGGSERQIKEGDLK